MREFVKVALEIFFKALYNKKYRSKTDRLSIFKTYIELYRISKRSVTESFTDTRFFEFKVRGFNAQSLLFLFEEIFLTKDYFFHNSSNNPIIIDCGANIGISCLFFSKFFPNATIYAFEPNPAAYELLVYNVRQNNLKNIHTFNKALSNSAGKVKIYNSNTVYGSLTTSVLSERGGDNYMEVDSISLSDFLINEQVDLIKMDVEGAEIEILGDLFKNGLIQKSTNYIIEYHLNLQNSGFAFPGFLDWFIQNNYSYNIKSTFYKLKSYQDLLLYFYSEK